MNSSTNLDQVGLARKRKKVPTLYEADESKYAGPHRWQITPWARLARRLFRRHAYTRWSEQAFERIEAINLENLEQISGPCVFVANHQSHLDTMVVQAAMPEPIRAKLLYGAAQDRWFVKGKKKLVLKPWYQSLALGTFPIMRGGGSGALSYASWLLEKQNHVFLFPEGTRATGKELGEFKHGATMLALEHNCPIVPIYLGGLKKIRPKGSLDVSKGVASIEFLAPITFAADTPVDEATAQVRDALNACHLRSTGGVDKAHTARAA